MIKDADTDLLPWICGALLLAIAAIAPAVAAPPATPAAVAQTPVKAAAVPPVPTTPVAAREALPAGEVWECVVNGERIFSDTRCGAHPTVRQLNAVNTMEATPILPPEAFDPPERGYSAGPAGPIPADYSNDVYTNPAVILVHGRGRSGHALAHHNGHAPHHRS